MRGRGVEAHHFGIGWRGRLEQVEIDTAVAKQALAAFLPLERACHLLERMAETAAKGRALVGGKMEVRQGSQPEGEFSDSNMLEPLFAHPINVSNLVLILSHLLEAV